MGKDNKNKKLQPKVIQYLEKNGQTRLDILVKNLFEETKVAKEKIEYRIKKMTDKGQVYIVNGVVHPKSKNPDYKKFDNIANFGALTLGRQKNIVSLSSKVNSASLDALRDSFRESEVKLKMKIEKELKDIEDIILKEYDPLDVLAYITTKNLLIDPETWTESSSEGNQLIPEIIQNIILKNEYNKYLGKNREDISKFEPLCKTLYQDINSYLLSHTIARPSLTLAEGEVYHHVLSTFVLVRGDAYPQHYKEISIELFSPIDEILLQKGFSIEEYWQTVEEIGEQIIYNFNIPPKELILEHKKYQKFFDEEIQKGTNQEEIIAKYKAESKERLESLEPTLKKLSEIALKGSFEIEINEKINRNLLNILSISFGDSEWKFPLDKNDTVIRPIISNNDKFYCFIAPHLIRNSIYIIENQLSNDEKVIYSDVKGNYFETKAIERLNRMILGDTYYGLRYPKGNEIDGIIRRNNIVFLIEVKGKKKRTIAGVEDILALTKSDLQAHILDAFNQTDRALKYIKSKPEVEFRDNDGRVLKLKQSEIKQIYKIVVSLEEFAKLALDMNLVRAWIPENVKSSEYPWVVSIYNLLIISDFLENDPDGFIMYLNERLQVAESSAIGAVDEIDYLGYFFEKGDLKKTKEMSKGDFAQIIGFSEKIDRWYSYLRGEIENAEKPERKKE